MCCYESNGTTFAFACIQFLDIIVPKFVYLILCSIFCVHSTDEGQCASPNLAFRNVPISRQKRQQGSSLNPKTIIHATVLTQTITVTVIIGFRKHRSHTLVKYLYIY